MLGILLFIGLIILLVWLLGLVLEFITGPILWVLLAIGIILVVVWLVTRITRRT